MMSNTKLDYKSSLTNSLRIKNFNYVYLLSKSNQIPTIMYYNGYYSSDNFQNFYTINPEQISTSILFSQNYSRMEQSPSNEFIEPDCYAI